MTAPETPRADTKPVRVVINALHAKSGGGVTYLRCILDHFARNPDIEFHLFLHEDQYDLFEPVPEGVHLHLLDFRASFLGLLIWEQLALPLLTRLMSADVTFSPANYGPLLAPRPVILLRNALSVVGGDRRFRKRIYWAGVAMMTLLSLLLSRKAIAVSNFALRQLTFGTEKLLGGKTTVIYHGVDPVFHSERAPDEEHPFLLAVADIYVQKNLHNLITAMPRVLESHPGLRLKIAGRPIDDDYFSDIRKLVAKEGIEESVEFLGYCTQEELIGLYARCKLLVFPSTVETFGNPLVEAMASGVPIVSSNSAAMPEIVNGAAIFFNPLDPVEIAERIDEVLGNAQTAARLSQAGTERAQDFSWEKTALETGRVLLEAARNAGRR